MSSLGSSHVSPAGNAFYPAPQHPGSGYSDNTSLLGYYLVPVYPTPSSMSADGGHQQYTPPFGAWQPHMDHYMYAQLPQVNDSNAQQHYPAQYRLLVGNLPRNLGRDAILSDLRAVFCPIGKCYLTLKLQQRYPTAFVQYTTLEHTQQGLRLHLIARVGDRVLRIEQARGSGSSTPQSGQNSGPALQQQPIPMIMDGSQGGSLSSSNNNSFSGSSTPQNWPMLGQAPQQQPDPTILNGIHGGSPSRVSNNGLSGYSTAQNGPTSGPAAQQHSCPMIVDGSQDVASSTAEKGPTSGPAPQLHSCLRAVCPDQGSSSSGAQDNRATAEETAKEGDKEDDKEKKEDDEEEEKGQKGEDKKEDHDDEDYGNGGQTTSDSNQEDENTEEENKHEEGEQGKKEPDSTSNSPKTLGAESQYRRIRALFSRSVRLMAKAYRRHVIECAEARDYGNEKHIIEGALRELILEDFERANEVLVNA